MQTPYPKLAIPPDAPLLAGNGVYDAEELLFPDSDGKLMADNTIQYRWMVTIKGNLESLYKNDPDVFVAGDLLWYAEHVVGTPRQAPDAMVVFGRPKGERGSWQPWKEDGAVPQVVFEILSPGNRSGEMSRKFAFYEKYGVEEYYIYEPKDGSLDVFLRAVEETGTSALRPADYDSEFVSPRMGVRFVLRPFNEAQIFYPDGRRFLTMQETDDARAEAERDRATANAAQAEANAAQAEAERNLAAARAERLAARLRELGIEPDAL